MDLKAASTIQLSCRWDDVQHDGWRNSYM